MTIQRQPATQRGVPNDAVLAAPCGDLKTDHKKRTGHEIMLFKKSGGNQLIVINYQFSSGFSCWSLPFIFHSAFKEVGEGFGYFTYILKY